MAKYENVSQLPLEERVRLARRDFHSIRHRLMALKKSGQDLPIGMEICERWGIANEEGLRAMSQADEVALRRAKKGLRQAQFKIAKNPLAAAMYIRERLADLFGRDKK